MPKTTLQLIDQVNCKFLDLDPHTRRKMVESLKFFLPHARHTPAFKLGRWDGTTSFSTVGGATFINVLDIVLPIVIAEGYSVEIEDLREPTSFTFPECDEFLLSDTLWPVGHVNAGDPIMLRDYQVDAINRFFQNTQSMQQISTGAGKCCNAVNRLSMEINPDSDFGKFLQAKLQNSSNNKNKKQDENTGRNDTDLET